MVVCTALIQRRNALRLTRMMQASFGERAELKWKWLRRFLGLNWKNPPAFSACSETSQLQSQAAKRHHPWSHVHSFYFIMGGFAFDTSGAKVNFLPNGRSRLTLSPKALKYLVDHAPHLIPDLSIENIRDKSKADGFAKMIVCVQALWFCLQCIVRLAQGQAISFLELNTFAHALCVFLLYAFWWHKPLDVDSPTLLEGDEAWELCALMCVNSNNGGTTTDYFGGITQTEMSHGQKYGDTTTAGWADFFHGRYFATDRQKALEGRMILCWDPYSISSGQLKADTVQRLNLDGQSDQAAGIRKGQSLFGFRCMDVLTEADFVRAYWMYEADGEVRFRITGMRNALSGNPRGVFNFESPHTFGRVFKLLEGNGFNRCVLSKDHQVWGHTTSSGREYTLQAPDLFRWELVSQAMLKYRPKQCRHVHKKDKYGTCCSLYDTIGDRSSNLSLGSVDDGDFSVSDLLFFLLIASIAGGLYGGLHLLAWNATFASRKVQICWKISGIMIASTGPITLATVLTYNLLYSLASLSIHRVEKSKMSTEFKTSWRDYMELCGILLWMAWNFCVLIPYIVARGYLIIESCMQVARLPPAAYELPEWSRYYPHIV